MSGSRRSSRGSAGMSQERGIRDRLRHFFGNSREEGLDGAPRRGSLPALHLAQDKLRVLGPDTDLNFRLKQMAALQPLLSSKRLDPNSLDALWSQIRDLIPRCFRGSSSPLSAEPRGNLLRFLQTLAQYQLGTGPATEVLRSTLFDAFKASTPTDFGECDVLVFQLIVILSERGTSGVGVDGGMGGFVVKWSEAIVRTVPICSVQVADWLSFLSDLVCNNAAGLEAEDAEQLVHLLCVHASSIVQEGLEEDKEKKVEEVRGCLRVLDRILRFSVFPRPLVHVLVTTLCKLVNAAALSELSWRVMRNVLSSYLGYTCVLRLCSLLESGVYTDPVVLRGAVFFLAMGLWGSQRVEALFYSPVAVLNSLRAGLRADELIVTYEALISVKRLVEKYGKELQHLSWNGILEIMDDVRKSFRDEEESSEKEEKVRELFHQVLDSMEGLAERGLYSGNQGQLYALIESCSAERPETSILRLLSFRAAAINPQCPAWIQDLHDLLWNYYFKDGRPTVRIKVVTILRNVYRNNRHLHDAALLQQVVLPILRHLPGEKDADVTSSGLSLLADMATETRARVKIPAGPRDEPTSVHSFRDAFLEILDILERLINQGLHQVKTSPPGEDANWLSEETFKVMDTVEAAVKQLAEILRSKWRVSPAYHSLHVLRLLAKTLSLQYSVGLVEELGSGVREHLVSLLIRLKANPATTRIGLVFENDEVGTVEWGGVGQDAVVEVEENPYLFCHDPALGPADYQEGGIEREVGMEWSWIADALLGVIRQERVWRVAQLLLVHLPEFLKNRALILSTPQAIPEITRALTEAAVSTEKVGTLIGPPETMTGIPEANLADFICPSLGILVAYRDNLEKRLQERIVSGIQTALVSGVSVRAVLGWILCIVELPTVVLGMSRDLVARLDGLRKTPAMIIPVFELSSTLLRLPNLYAQFREADFLHVFDALLPATDTFAFTTFIVAVGHHLVYRWFLKVPIPLRPRIATHIRKRLEEIRVTADSKGPGGDPQLGMDENMLMDEFLRHYTYTNAPADADPPLPSILIDLIKAQGWTRHWVQGNRVVSISAVMQRGYVDPGSLCKKCVASLAKPKEEVEGAGGGEASSLGAAEDFGAARKRHQSAAAAQTRVTRPPAPLAPTSHDDFHLPLRTETHIKPHTLCGCWSRGYTLVEIRHTASHINSTFMPSYVSRHPFGKSFWVMEVNGATVSRLQDAQSIMKLSRMLSNKRKESSEETGAAEVSLLTRGQERLMSEVKADEAKSGVLSGTRDRSSSETSLSERQLLSPQTSLGPGEGEKMRRGSGSGRFGPRPCNEPLTINISRQSEEGNGEGQGSGDSSSNYASAKSTPCPPTLEESPFPPPDLKTSDPPLGLNPAWIFTQLFPSSNHDDSVVLPWQGKDGESVERSLRNLDLLPPYEAHKIGVIYAAPKQTTEAAMLANHCGTERYMRFLEGLGKLLPLKGGNREGGAQRFLGTLDPNGADGLFTYHWTDPITQVLFDVATLMPTKERDKECRNKKRHIGNDFVTIVYNDSGHEYQLGTLSGQFAFVAIVVTPLHHQTLSLKLLAKDEISRWLSLKEAVVSDKEAPLLCRQIGMRAEFSAHCWQSGQQAQAQGRRSIRATYISGAMERLLHIRGLRTRHQPNPTSPH